MEQFSSFVCIYVYNKSYTLFLSFPPYKSSDLISENSHDYTIPVYDLIKCIKAIYLCPIGHQIYSSIKTEIF